MNIKAVIFDNDGTLFDFQDTCGAWMGKILERLAVTDKVMFENLAQALKYDAET